MVDYDKASGSGTLRIRDLGSVVEYWVKPYYSDFWWENLSFSVTANGSTTTYTPDVSGNSWVKITSRTINSSQTTTFKLNTATGTSSLGGPTTFSQYIDRADIPPIPDKPAYSGLTATTVHMAFSHNGDGGATLDGWQIARNTSWTTVGATIVNTGSDQTYDWTGLTPGDVYYFWARVHNVKGWSGWSPVLILTTLRKPFPPSTPVLTNATQNSLNVKATDGDNGGSAITSRQFAYNTVNSLTGATIVAYDGDAPVTNLPPGRKLWFWARTTNAYGTSDWSPAAVVTLIAGATVTVDGVVQRALPWVNVAGVWKLARPWGKVAGNWNKSAT